MQIKYIQNNKIIAVVVVAYVLFIFLIYLIINHALLRSMEQQAVMVAEIVAIQATSARSVYSTEVAEKLTHDGLGPSVHSDKIRGYVPLPVQFLKKMGLQSTRNTSGLFSYRLVSKWNLEASQGLTNDFLRWSWPQLEAQDVLHPTQAIDWKAIWRVETDLQGQRVLRYLKADPAAQHSCISCHNEYEQSSAIIEQRQVSGVSPGKQWVLHQLLGALYVTIPLDKVEMIAHKQNRQTIVFVILISFSAILITSLFLRRLFKQGQSLHMLSYQASHDSLTGLVNRRGFERYIDLLYDEADSTQAIEHVLCMMDLDGFKQVNDRYGHQVGDELLVAIANTLKIIVRSKDVVARMGGDEFAVILNSCSVEKAKEIAQTLLDGVRNCKIRSNDIEISVGISIGLGSWVANENKIDQTINAIDAACYAAKNNGKNQIFYTDGNTYEKI